MICALIQSHPYHDPLIACLLYSGYWRLTAQSFQLWVPRRQSCNLCIMGKRSRTGESCFSLSLHYCSQVWDRVLTVYLSPSVESLMCLHNSSSLPDPFPPLSSFSKVEGSFVDIALPGVVQCAAESTAHRCPCRVFLYVLFPQAGPVATSSSSSGRLSPSFLRSPLVLPWPEMPHARGLLETELSSSVSWQTSSRLDKT